MEARTVEETHASLGSVVVYAALVCLLAALLVGPSLVSDEYARTLNTLLLLAILGLVGRTLVSALLAFASTDPPALAPDADLPTVSVVIPAYNEASVLPDTIAACRALAYPADKLEVILCYESDCSDDTGAICERAAATDERFVALERDEPGGGKAKAANYALQHASGELIASIDADHQFAPHALRRAAAWFLADENLWCVKGRCYGRNPTDSLLALHATVERHIAEKADIFAREVLGSFTFFGGGQAFFRAEAFRELGAFDEEILVEDIDMSSKIHAAGKRLRIDPGIVTYEENPATFASWWSQRKRWARGWMQVAARYLTSLPRESNASVRARLDAVYTLTYAVVPVLLVAAFPMMAFNFDPNVPTATYIPVPDGLLWNAVAVAPVVVSYIVFLQDRLDGLSHHPREYLAAFTLWFYLVFQTLVFVVAFIEEFVLRKPSVYVTTSRVE